MSDLKASVTETKAGFHVEGYEKIEYDFTFLDGVFNKQNSQLADCFTRWKRCLAIMDLNIFNLYGQQLQDYFDHHGLELKVHKTMIGEKAKSMETLLSIVDSMNEFGEKTAPNGGRASLLTPNAQESYARNLYSSLAAVSLPMLLGSPH